jgi:hypothetical protein
LGTWLRAIDIRIIAAYCSPDCNPLRVPLFKWTVKKSFAGERHPEKQRARRATATSPSAGNRRGYCA